ncbi:hypothetical protein KP509_22G079600 [Ceratopteris richardii]|nr:hypothetical protein KP509_22G079600 [Ceratopteris richardii]
MDSISIQTEDNLSAIHLGIDQDCLFMAPTHVILSYNQSFHAP